MNFGAIFRTLGPRILGTLFAGAATYIGVKTSGAVQIDPSSAAEIVIGTLASYAAAHRGVSAIVNKGDSATGRVAEATNVAADTGSTVKVAPKL